MNRMRIIRICLCIAAAIIAGVAAAAAIQLAEYPGIWHRMNLLWDNAFGEGLFYALVPAMILALISLRGTAPSLPGTLLVCVAWLALLFAMWAKKPIEVYGVFPWTGFRRHFIGLLPIPLASALAFSICGRKLLNQPTTGPAGDTSSYSRSSRRYS
jgi:hypothetical protein